MNVLIIDDAPDFRALAAHFVKIEWPDAEITQYDPVTLGRPASDFGWSQFDVVLLDFMLGIEDGLDWLRAFRKVPNLPPVIFMTGSGSEDVAAKAIKLGAADYLRKHDLSRNRLVSMIRDAISEAEEARGPELVLAPSSAAHSTVMPASSEFSVRPAAGAAQETIQINGYRLIRKLGEGGMAVVFLTEHADSGEERVLKILDTRVSTDPAFLDRFILEYGIVSRISSPYVIRIWDQGFTNDHAYISMEYLPGGDLKQRIRAGLNSADALRIFRQLIEALKGVHEAGIIHRDLKPQNIMFRADGSIALLDFGIAKEAESEHNLTKLGFIVGTPNYISPEQVTGIAVDARADLYGAGAILVEMLTGRPPYSAETLTALLYAHCHAPIPQLPDELAAYQPLIDKLLAKQPAARYQSARELLAGNF